MNLTEQYKKVRTQTETICRPLKTEDYVVQPVVDVSPPKWHLGHSTWFFETFILKPYAPGYEEYDPNYNFVFNSYYETVGARVIRTDRGNLSRPSVDDIYQYRKYVDEHMLQLLSGSFAADVKNLIILGLHHEQQHQELLYTDIKYILGHNPLFPSYSDEVAEYPKTGSALGFLKIPAGNYEIGYEGDGFCFDNEQKRHTIYLQEFEIATGLVSNKEYLEFMNDGGYQNFRYWHAEGWDWVKTKQVAAPLYWHNIHGAWHYYTYRGLQQVEAAAPVCHVSYYEAAAFAAWKEMRLPTEGEWEIAAPDFEWGQRWEWTESAYLPYPGFAKAAGAIGEYNGKFMVNQMVLRGASVVTSQQHSRITYRNFFHPYLQWQFTGIRLAK